MNLDADDYAWLSKGAYTDHQHDEVGHATVELNGQQYKVIDYEASSSGFHGTAFQQVEPPHGIIIAYRGTDPDHRLTTIQDGAVDAIMVTGKVNPQVQDAERFTERVLEYAKQHGIPQDQITVAGHSLGGTLAQVEAYRHRLRGQTFNAYGAAELGLRIPEGGSQVIDNVLAGDPVSAAGHQFGIVRVYATKGDIEHLQQAGYQVGCHGFVPALQAMRLGDHSIDNFAPDPGKGLSVLTAENETRAKANEAAIGYFRRDVHRAREGIHLATQPGMPLVGVQATAWSVQGLATVGLATSSALETARDALEREAIHSARTAEHGAHAMVNGIKHAYDATHDKALEGVNAAEHVIHRAYDTSVRSTVQGVNATERTLAQGVQAMGPTAHAAAERASMAYDTLIPPHSWLGGVPANPAHPILLDHADHPDHALYQQARRGVHQLDADMQRTPDQHSNNLAAALAVEGRRQGLTRIDQVALSKNGEHAFALQSGLYSQIAHVQTADAVNASLAQSSASWVQANQQAAARSAPPQAMPAAQNAPQATGHR